jgi:hypothetical protein
MARDYREATFIIEDSPRMSSVLSRRILADLLEKYAGLTQYDLAARIDAFIKDTVFRLDTAKTFTIFVKLGIFPPIPRPIPTEASLRLVQKKRNGLSASS